MVFSSASGEDSDAVTSWPRAAALAQQLGALGRLVDDQDAHRAVAFCLLCISSAILP